MLPSTAKSQKTKQKSGREIQRNRTADILSSSCRAISWWSTTLDWVRNLSKSSTPISKKIMLIKRVRDSMSIKILSKWNQHSLNMLITQKDKTNLALIAAMSTSMKFLQTNCKQSSATQKDEEVLSLKLHSLMPTIATLLMTKMIKKKRNYSNLEAQLVQQWNCKVTPKLRNMQHSPKRGPGRLLLKINLRNRLRQTKDFRLHNLEAQVKLSLLMREKEKYPSDLEIFTIFKNKSLGTLPWELVQAIKTQ